MSNSIQAALQRNKTYKDFASDEARNRFRRELVQQLRAEATRYVLPVSDTDHYAVIRRISEVVSRRSGESLLNNRLRYGTAQKAFNLYLKFLWRLGKAATPPHCPVDSIVMAAAGIDGAWTKSDSENEYMRWIDKLRRTASPLSIAEWEYGIWLRGAGSGSNESTTICR